MSAAPLTLYDLRETESSIRATCGKCGATKTFDREVMIADRRQFQRSCDWHAVKREMMCPSPSCDARALTIEAIPFSDDPVVLRRRRAVMLLVNLSLSILSSAAHGAKQDAYDPTAIRLALRVLAPHVARNDLLTEFWQAITDKSEIVGIGPHQVKRWIVSQLVDLGYAVWAEWR